MSIIIRLQGLPITANSLDIRRFFSGLTIPDGGVHIIGGEQGVAFIAFANDEDARQAMARETDGLIKDSRIKLFLSSRNEMKQVIDKARNQNLTGLKLKSSSTTTTNQTVAVSSTLNQTSNTNQTISSSSLSLGNNSLQEAPDYRRNKSPSDFKANKSANQLPMLAKERSNSPFVNARSKTFIDNGRTFPNTNPTGGYNTAAIRSRLGGFNVASSNDNRLQAQFGDPSQGNNDHWNSFGGNHPGNGANGVMNGIAFNDAQSNPSSSYLNSHHHPMQNASGNRVMNNGQFSNSFFDHPSHHQQFQMNDAPSGFSNHAAGMGPANNANRFLRAVELRGLPIDVQTVEFQTFFRPVGVLIDRDQIKLSLDAQGLFHGVAHIFFFNEADLEKALLLNGRTIRDYPIEVLPVVQNGPLLNTPPHAAICNNGPDGLIMGPMNFGNNDMMGCNRNIGDSFTRRHQTLHPVFMKGIPYDACNVDEVGKFFSPIPIFETIIIQERSGRPTGNAYVLFDSDQAFEAAMKRNSRYMGKRYIELFACPMEEIEKYKAKVSYRQQQQNREMHNNFNEFGQSIRNRKRRHSEDRSSNEGNNANHAGAVFCVQIKGLPPNVDNHDLTNYFRKLNVTTSAVHIMLKPDGQNAGECFVQFKSAEFLNCALRQDGDRMDNHILSIKEVPFRTVASVVGLQSSKKRDFGFDRRSTVHASVSPRATINDICALFEDYNLRPDQIEAKLENNDPRSDEYLIHFRNPKEADRVIRNMNRKHFIDKLIFLRLA